MYSPELGRWLSRDPIGERGGLNIYGFALNSPVIFFDYLGLSYWDCCSECSPGQEPRVISDRVVLKDALTHSPGMAENGYSVLKDVQRLKDFQNVARIGNNYFTKGIAAVLKQIGGVGFHHYRSLDMASAMVDMLGTFDAKTSARNGVAIWVEITWEECEETSCIWGKCYAWIQKKDWNKPDVNGSGPTGEGFALDDVNGIEAATPGAVAKAIENLVH
jgi:hypothetical protein